MGLFVVRHQHEPANCPAEDADLGAMLLNHISRPSLRRQGVEVHGEAVLQGEHTLYLILESDQEDLVREFMQPFAAAGSVDIYPASTCARVVASGGCAVPAPPADELVPALDPEEACQRALDAGLLVHRAHPLNCETSIPDLIGGVMMPSAHFYVRNHFQVPKIDADSWRLEVGGLVERPHAFGLRQLQQMPSRALMVTLECAGNGRSLLQPPVDGEKWGLGAVSTAEWTGVPLAEVLDQTGVDATASQVVFQGADRGAVPGSSGNVRYERSLSVDNARDSGALLAYAMNGEPLPIQHGYPLRLVVPGWYGMASVKWLTDIRLTDGDFHAYYQTDRYVYEWDCDGEVEREPVTIQRVRALITEPQEGEHIPTGDLLVRGVAWSGASAVARVDVSIDGGPWQEARLTGERKRHSWQRWELIARADVPGPVRIRARATDLAGRTQPERPEWNRLGYGANAIQQITAVASPSGGGGRPRL